MDSHASRLRGLSFVVFFAALLCSFALSNQSAKADEKVLVESVPPQAFPTMSTSKVLLDPATSTVKLDNAGNGAPLVPQCVTTGQAGGQWVCVGTSGLMWQGDPTLPAVTIKSGYYYPGYKPALTRLIEEAVTVIMARHDLTDRNMVYEYARPEIRSYLLNRFNDLLDQALYGETMTPEDQRLYDELTQAMLNYDRDLALNTLAEYKLWEQNPCGYKPPPPPPGSGLAVIPNPTAGIDTCLSNRSVGHLYRITNNTPSVEQFQTWASYRYPSPTMRVGNRAEVAQALKNQMIVDMHSAGAGAFALGAGATGLIIGTSETIALAAFKAILPFGSRALTGAAAAAAGIVPAIAVGGTVVAAVVLLVEASILVAEDLAIPQKIFAAANEAEKLTDPFRLNEYKPFYASLDYETRQIHPELPPPYYDSDVQALLTKRIVEWTMFDSDGEFMPDPVNGYDAGPAPSDIKFRLGTVDDQDYVVVKAPPGSTDDSNQPVDAYRMYMSRGWMMVSSLVDGVWSAPKPQLRMTYLNHENKPSIVSVVRHRENPGDQGAVTGFQHTYMTVDGTRVSNVHGEFSPYWFFKRPDGSEGSAMIQPKALRTPEINVLPSIHGTLQQGHMARLDSNLSRDGYGVNGGFEWKVDRFDEDGEVVDSFTSTALRFDRRFNQPGSYRAVVTYRATVGGQPFQTTGQIRFEIKPATPKVTGTIRTDPSNRAKRFLALKFEQDTPSETFYVKINWADDRNGSGVIRDYTVTCQQIPGPEPVCDSRDWAPGMDAENANWSSPPVFELDERQQYRNLVNVSYRTSPQQEWQGTDLTFANPEEGMPKYKDMQPRIEMPVGVYSEVPVTEIEVSDPVPPGQQPASIMNFYEQISDSLPADLRADLVPISSTRMRLVIKGTPQSDDIGPHSAWLPVEGYPQGIGLFPKPALVSLDIVSSLAEGYRALVSRVPDQQNFVQLREYPEMIVEVAHKGTDPDPAPFEGTVYCKLSHLGSTVFEKPCAQDEPFPWPEEKLDTSMEASVWAESNDQPVESEPYTVRLNLVHVHANLEVEKGGPGTRWSELKLELRDHKFYSTFGWVPKPFSAGPNPYQVTCRFDDETELQPCLDDGEEKVLRSPGEHQVEVRVVAPDGHAVVERLTWQIEFPDHADFTVSRPVDFVRPADSLPLKGSGLLPGERYEIRFAGDRVAVGRATEAGEVSESIAIPARASEGSATIELVGQAPGRRGTAEVSVVPAKRLAVAISVRHYLGGSSLPVTVSGLLAGEPYELSLAGRQQKGLADADGTIRANLALPRLGHDQPVTVQAVGFDQSRQGDHQVLLLTPRKRLKLKLKKRRVRVRARQFVKIRGLAPGEPFTVRLGKKRLTTRNAKANRHGVATLRFKVKKRTRRQKVTVQGLAPGRKGRAAFRVVSAGR